MLRVMFVLVFIGMSPPAWGIQIMQPLEGTNVHPGDQVKVVAIPLPGESIESVLFNVPSSEGGIFDFNPPFEYSFTVPREALGELKIFVSGKTPDRTFSNASVTIKVILPSGMRLERLRVSNDQEKMFMPPQSSHALYIYGHYSDGVERRVEASFAGTTYSTSDSKIATVDKEGLVGAVAPGKAIITVNNADKQLQVEVIVEAQPLPGSFLPTVPGLKLESMVITPSSLTLSLQSEATRSKRLDVEGLFSDGLRRKITFKVFSTKYQSSNEQVATVDKDGLVTAKGVGEAIITIKNEDKTVQIPVKVE